MKYTLPHFTLDLKSPSGSVTDFVSHDASLKEKFRSEIGFYDWPAKVSERELTEMKTAARHLIEEFDGALVIGIGGSHLGPEALLRALRSPDEAEKFPIHWLTNVDSGAVRDAVHFVGRRDSACVAISKSGGTVETLSGFFHVSSKMDSKGFVVITDPEKGELRRLAGENDWKSFPVPPNIGGRFSVLTAVGLFPALLAGLDVTRLLKGAKAVRDELEKNGPAKNPAYAFAAALHAWDVKHDQKAQYLMPYSTQLQLLGDWWVQLWGESLGKEGRGPTPVAALGTSDQHSLLQLFKEGPVDKVVGFMAVAPRKNAPVIGKPEFKVSDSFSFLFPRTFDEVTYQASLATEKSLNNSGVPTYRFELKDIDAETLGALMFFFETACAFAGELYGIDAFNQPGVEESKKLLRESL